MAPTEPSRPWVRQACPGVAAPMATGDGLLLRLRHPIGGLSPEQARLVAEVARRHGSGVLELTSRGNLQLRGFSDAGLPAARDRLAAAGLADADPGREAVRNVVAAPVADADPEAVADVRSLARELAEAVTARPALRQLPPKVGLLVDGGGRARLDGLAADLRLEAADTAAGIRYRLAVGGTARSATVLGWVAPQQAVTAAVTVLEAFLALRETAAEPPRRLAEAVARFGSEPLRHGVALEAAAGADPVAQRPAADPLATLGADPQGGWLGAALPFGTLDAEQLAAMAELVEPAAGGMLRLTPWRALLLTGARAGAEQDLERLGAITHRDDRRLALSACVGAPGCQAAQAETRAAAADMAEAAGELLATGGRLHVSGCDKWCGDPAAATVILTATDKGFELAVSDGAAAETVASGLSPQAAQRWLTGLGRVLAREQQPGERVDETVRRLGHSALTQRAPQEAGHDR